MGAIKRDFDRRNPTISSAGVPNAQTLTYSVPPPAQVQGQRFSFIAGFTNTGATTLQVLPLAAKAVQLGGAALMGGEIVAGSIVDVTYDGTQFQITSSAGMLADIRNGKLINTSSVTLLSGTVATALANPLIDPQSVLLFMPTTANAAVALATLYVATVGMGTATITHANTSDGDKTFLYSIIG
jgi:hypothetical protein